MLCFLRRSCTATTLQLHPSVSASSRACIRAPLPFSLLPRDVAPKVAVHWYNRRKGADSAVSLALCTGFRGVCTRQFTARSSPTLRNVRQLLTPAKALQLIVSSHGCI